MGVSRSQRRSNARSLAVLLCLMVLVESALGAALINVAGKSGWSLGYNYKSWASSTRVRPGDTLFFKYDPRVHNVLLVTKADYNACRTTAPRAKLSSGKDKIKFSKAGTYYIICGVGTHCKSGMKLTVNVRR